MLDGVRFIPTPVGNTAASSPWCRPSPVHPHARGEHGGWSQAWSAMAGSSPRPWGTRTQSRSRSRIRLVHPHARGEHCMMSAMSLCTTGSSPRPWGTQPQLWRQRRCRRFIPTPVGNTTSSATAVRCETVHPHARGEHRMLETALSRSTGSSPRPWGTRVAVPLPVLGDRFIPTPVGNTICGRGRCFLMAVHPHARGEHTKCNSLSHQGKMTPPKSTESAC